MEICETDRRSYVEAGGLFSNMAEFHVYRHFEILICLWRHVHAAIWLVEKVGTILALENNSIHCCRNNSLLFFSARDWLPALWAMYTTSTISAGTRATEKKWIPLHGGRHCKAKVRVGA